MDQRIGEYWVLQPAKVEQPARSENSNALNPRTAHRFIKLRLLPIQPGSKGIETGSGLVSRHRARDSQIAR
jgi:hypothetical protein